MGTSYDYELKNKLKTRPFVTRLRKSKGKLTRPCPTVAVLIGRGPN